MNGLEGLKKGDRVTIIHHHRFGDVFITGSFEVDHVTPTLVVGKDTPCGTGDPIPGTRVRIETGKVVGDNNFSGTNYYASTHPHVAAVRQAAKDREALAKLKAAITKAVAESHDIPTLLKAVNAALPHPPRTTLPSEDHGHSGHPLAPVQPLDEDARYDALANRYESERDPEKGWPACGQG